MVKEGKKLAKIISSLKDEKVISDFLTDILTPGEIEDIALRIEILKLLDKGLTQREISKKLGLSISTVTRGSRVLKYGTGAIRKLLKSKIL